MNVPQLVAPTLEDCEEVRGWRNAEGSRATLRTPMMLTQEQQAAFYRDVVCDRSAPHRYWSLVGPDPVPRMPKIVAGSMLLAFGGLTDIEWENGAAQISLIVRPDVRGHGVGREAVRLILREAFERMRLLTVHGEVYDCNPASAFWRSRAGTNVAYVPGRKWWDGRLHGSLVFWFSAPRPNEEATSVQSA